MHGEIRFSLDTLYGFLLTLTRVSGMVAFLPVPGFRDGPELSRIVLALALAILLLPVWPAIPVAQPAIGQLAGWVAAELGIGIAIGVAVSFLLEGFQVAAQVIGLQAGYQYASTIDPTTQADATVLQIVLQLFGSLLFFQLGLDRELIRLLATSLAALPAGHFAQTVAQGESIVRLGSGMFSTGIRLAMPALALLILVDIAFALLGRVHAQLQLLSLSFSIKMTAGIWVLAASLIFYPAVLERAGEQTAAVLFRLMGQ